MESYSLFMDRKTQYCQDVTSNLIYRVNAIPIKIPASYFVHNDKLCRINKLILKFYGEAKDSE